MSTATARPEIEVNGFVIAGTPHGFEVLGPHDEVTCCQCGARLVNVYVTDRGPMGGDCLATLTGDNATRAAMQRARKALGKVLHLGRISRLGIDVHYSNASRAWPVRAYVAGNGWRAIGFANTAVERARWGLLLSALAAEIGAEVVDVPANAPAFRFGA